MLTEYLERLLAALEAGPSAADWIAAVSTAITALIAGGALIFAWRQVDEAKQSRKLTRDLEIERAQPYVVAFTEESPATNLAIDLVIKNFGPTAATNVRVALDPWPERAGRHDEGARVGIPTFPVLAPGQEWRTAWVWAPDRKDSGLPERHEGTVTFLGIDDKELTSPVVLDLGVYMQREWVEVRGIHDAANALRDIRDNQKKWTEGVVGPLSVVTRDGDAKDQQERIRLTDLRRRNDEAKEARAAAEAAAAEEAAAEEAAAEEAAAEQAPAEEAAKHSEK